MAGATDESTAPRDLELICTELNPALDLLQALGLRLDVIYPADCPHTAMLSRAGQKVRLTSQPDSPLPSDELPAFQPEFVLTLAGDSSGEGRAGMHYRDLIPSRLGGRYIASHITIAQGGPVPDWVHYHRVAFQMIYVRKGWVRIVYEDQGEPFVMHAGDLVLQPPEIRHRVLESSPGLEVVEISCPALHETLADHDMALPNGRLDIGRSFCGQHFLRHMAADTPWIPLHGMEAQETAICEATSALAEVRTLRRGASVLAEFPPHHGELMFGFVLEGTASLRFGDVTPLAPADAFVIPPGEPWSLSDASGDLRLLQVTTVRFS
jgi:quercetin dioxygenase-like cupin family protein